MFSKYYKTKPKNKLKNKTNLVTTSSSSSLHQRSSKHDLQAQNKTSLLKTQSFYLTEAITEHSTATATATASRHREGLQRDTTTVAPAPLSHAFIATAPNCATWQKTTTSPCLIFSTKIIKQQVSTVWFWNWFMLGFDLILKLI